jgi:transcriptional regulator with XRE-family HTH domain
MEENDFVSIWLEESGNPAIAELTQLNLDLAAKATRTLADQGLTENDLAVAVDINPDEIKRWLAGRHPFSIKTLKEISAALTAAANSQLAP